MNHFPGSTELTHKNKLALNIRAMKDLFTDDYKIIPETYILPDEYDLAYEAMKTQGGLWISKPYAYSQGRGIHLVIYLSPID